MTTRRPLITEIPHAFAVPFIVAYCAQYAIPCDTQGAENIAWWGAWYHNALRAVLGLMPVIPPIVQEVLPEEEADDSLFVYGIYGDSTTYQDRAIYSMISALHRVPHRLVGTIYLPNTRMYRAMKQRGWQFAATLPRNLARVLTRAPGAA